MEENQFIQISDLNISFQEQSVVHDLNLDIQKGETLAIVGESGSGKSLTALSLLRLLPKNATLDGKILWRAPTAPMQEKDNDTVTEPSGVINIPDLAQESLQMIRGHLIAMIFQEPMTSLNPVKSCGTQVAEAIMIHKKQDRKTARRQVIQLFKEVQLPQPEAIYDRYPHEISGGQKQRVMIAMAMSCQPQLLICDEPTTALDVMVQKEILQLIKTLQRKTGMSVLFISHDIKLVEEIADRIAVFYQGRLMELGPCADLMRQPKNPYTKALLTCRPGLYQKGERLPVVTDFLTSKKQQKGPEAQHSEKNPLPAQQPFITNSQSPILTLRDLQVWYPSAHNFWGRPVRYNKAVEKVSFEVYAGETLGLVGGSGCGKTTLGRAIIGLTPIHGGEIRYKNGLLTPALRKPSANAREIQMIFQDPYGALNPKITIGEAIAETLYVHKILPRNQIKAEVIHWLDRVGLRADQYDRYPHEFSGGQRQRIVIARALALKPSFVICDESVSALDVSVQAQILNLFNELKAALNFTSIFISHDLSVVKYLCDRIAVMNQGKLEEIGPSEQVYYHSVSPFTKALLAAIPGANSHG